jgi:O-acetyl-ADP-ribose deacetylase (regulator of RNase III)
VASGADYCANCGEDLRPHRGVGAGWIVLAAVVALLVGGGIAYALAKGSNNTKTTTVQKTVSTKAGPSSTGISVTTPTRTVTGPTSTVTRTSTTTTTTSTGSTSKSTTG